MPALAIIFAALMLIAPGARPAHAETPPTGTITVVTADGKPRGVQLRSQTVDATIREDRNGVWADTQLWALLRNPGKGPVVLSLALGGPQLGATALPEILDATADGKPLKLQPLVRPNDTAPIAYTAPITIPKQSGVALRVRYRQALPQDDGVALFTYPITATLRWPGGPESLRVTVKLAPELAAEQVLGQAPAGGTLRRDGIVWTWDAKRPEAYIGVAVVAPSWWQAFTAARTAAAAPAAAYAEHWALAQRYHRLAAQPAPAFDPQADFYARYHPAELAELRAGLAAANALPPADHAAAHVHLAQVYLEDAQRGDPSRAEAYTAAAAAELAAAVALTPADAALRTQAGDLYRQLAAVAADRGDATSAAQHRTRAAALAAGEPARPQALAQSAALTEATQAAEAGDLAHARRIVAAAFGPDAATLPDLPPPAIRQAIVTVETTESVRTLTLQVSDADEQGKGAALLARAAAALAATPGAKVSTDGARLTITLPFTDATGLSARQAALADALPPQPELALLAAALRPTHLALESRRSWLFDSKSYVEFADLGSARQTWEAAAERLAAAGRGGASEGRLAQDPRLAALQRAFWAADAAAWRALAISSRGEYGVALSAGKTVRRWTLPTGALQVLDAHTRHFTLKL